MSCELLLDHFNYCTFGVEDDVTFRTKIKYFKYVSSPVQSSMVLCVRRGIYISILQSIMYLKCILYVLGGTRYFVLLHMGCMFPLNFSLNYVQFAKCHSRCYSVIRLCVHHFCFSVVSCSNGALFPNILFSVLVGNSLEIFLQIYLGIC
jgi:hypothetical protein